MATDPTPSAGPDFGQGVALEELADGLLAGHVDGEEVLLVRSGAEIFAIAAHCSHYHAPLKDGLVVGDTIRCAWHHACFALASGEALRPPALSPLDRWRVEQRDGRVWVREKLESVTKRRPTSAAEPQRIVIVGGGAAGFAAAEMLRRCDYRGELVVLSSEDAAPIDRPNLSKDYLAGAAPEDWMPLRPASFYQEAGIELRLGAEVTGIDARERWLTTSRGDRFGYDRLLLAAGAEPVRLPIPGAGQPPIHTLRSMADCRAIIAAAEGAKTALVIGASFIGLEAAASLRARGLEVHVVAPEARPMERILGAEMGDFIRALHEAHGVVFHLEDTVAGIEGHRATLTSGRTLDVGLVVMGVGVRPRLALAEQAGLALDRGLSVDAHLETSAPGVYAAGDIARWPDPRLGQSIRVEHWSLAERQGQTAALNMLGERAAFDAVPFFWSQHYDVPINYVGHAPQWDEIAVDGDIGAKDCLVRYKAKGRVLAVASIFRDVASLEAEVAMERETAS
jgi:NADPH-dependent 2,4-dienoyl-CoA reductase/sulfur reductase-like enzyme/nitrite reductase/ring-hydroxylating ferredoxin subunit